MEQSKQWVTTTCIDHLIVLWRTYPCILACVPDQFHSSMFVLFENISEIDYTQGVVGCVPFHIDGSFNLLSVAS